MKNVSIGLLAGLLVGVQALAAPVKATLDTGVLVGDGDGAVNVFRGVPFAKPPVGALRWKAPQKPDAWFGERAAIADEPPCPQPVTRDGKVNGGGVIGVQSEDCLYATVFAPANAKNAPIMVWFYGGGFFLGANHLGSFSGTSNAQNGVITVAVNYRLGALGFFSHPALTKEAGGKEPLGSYALMDGVAALEWVKRNGAAFGGDINNVTIAGQSAGGALVTNLLSVPSAKGLYHKAVVQSGAMLGPVKSVAELEPSGVAAMKSIGLPENATAAQLRAVSAQTLVAGAATRRGLGAPLDGRFRPISTIDALNAGTEIDVPVMVGSNSGEGGFDGARTLARLSGDSGAGAWLYHFAHVPAFRKDEWKQGAIHSAELMFTFDSLDTSSWATTASGKADYTDFSVAKQVNSCWVAFYKMDPKAKSFTCADGFSWPAYTEAGDDAAQFNATPKVVKSKTIPSGPPRNATGG
jgi:para-nitrobenzyl esterase